MSNLTSNPKQPNRVTRYNPNLQRTIQAQQQAQQASQTGSSSEGASDQSVEEPPADWMALASLILGVMGLMLRYKLCAWFALFACMSSVSTMRKRDMDFKQVFCSILFAVMSLLMNYFGAPVKQAGVPAPI